MIAKLGHDRFSMARGAGAGVVPSCVQRWTPWLVLFFSVGCTRVIVTPNLVLPEPPPDRYDWSAWGQTLSRIVKPDGVDYGRLFKDRRPLDRALVRMARTGPATSPGLFPDDAYRLAYLINCYNATLVRSVLELARDESLPQKAPGDLDGRFRFEIDGRLVRPLDLRKGIRSLAGDDWRIELALCNARRGGPSLQRRPLLGSILDAQLDRIVRDMIASDRIVFVDHENMRLLMWSGLYGRRKRLVDEYEVTYQTEGAGVLNALTALADRGRRIHLNTAVGYPVGVLAADDTINAHLPPPEDQPTGLFSILPSIRFPRP